MPTELKRSHDPSATAGADPALRSTRLWSRLLKGAPTVSKPKREHPAMNVEHARTFNPAGISYGDANRSLHLAGYSDADISSLIAVVGHDRWGQQIWRWRTDHHAQWEDEGFVRRGPYPADPTPALR